MTLGFYLMVKVLRMHGTRLGLAYGRDDFCTKYFRSAIFSAHTKHGICYTVD